MPCSTPVDQTGAFAGFFPVRTAFPVSQAGQRPRLHFRGLLKLHSRYGLQGCSATMRGLGHKAPAHPVARSSRLSATRLTDIYLGGSSTHWRSAPLGRTEKSRLESCNPFIPSAPDVRSDAMDPAHPSGGFCTFISGGRVDQSQPLRASIGWTRELILVH
jgi:hypothetical protein